MDERKVKKFKDQQKRLAKKIAKKYKIDNFTVSYEQQIPSVYTDLKTGKLIIGDKSQYIFSTTVSRKGKHRLIVVMCFQGIYDFRVVGKILRRHFEVKYIENGFMIISSFNPQTIAKF